MGISGSERLGSWERNLNKLWVASEDPGDSGSHRGPLGGITICHLPPEVALSSKTLATQHMHGAWNLRNVSFHDLLSFDGKKGRYLKCGGKKNGRKKKRMVGLGPGS